MKKQIISSKRVFEKLRDNLAFTNNEVEFIFDSLYEKIHEALLRAKEIKSFLLNLKVLNPKLYIKIKNIMDSNSILIDDLDDIEYYLDYQKKGYNDKRHIPKPFTPPMTRDQIIEKISVYMDNVGGVSDIPIGQPRD